MNRAFFILSILLLSMNSLSQTTILSENFENGWNGWNSYVDWAAEGGAALTTDNGSTALLGWTTNTGSESWHLHLRKDGLTLNEGKAYTVTFDARCEEGWTRPINMKVEQGYDPYTNFSNAPSFQITDQVQTFTYTFTMEYPTDIWAGICFEYGHFDRVNDPIDIYVDNIIITEHDALYPIVEILSPSKDTSVNASTLIITWSVAGVAQSNMTEESLVEGLNTVIRSYTNDAGLTGADTVAVVLDTEAPIVDIISPNEGDQFYTTPISVEWYVDGTIQTVELEENLVEGLNTITRSSTDEAGNIGEATLSVYFVADTNVPVDPSKVAPVLDTTEQSTIDKSVEFIYTGENAIQKEVVTEIDEDLVCVIRGLVMERDSTPLAGVKVSISNHAEYGYTYTRVDGTYDLVVNGGGELTVRVEKNNYLASERTVSIPMKEFIWAPNIVLIPLDTVVTVIDPSSDTMQIAQGSLVSDEDGDRQATIFFPAGVEIVGGTGGSFSVRATEYTVGENGPEAMPATLPATTAYTYCVELSVDGMENVTFTQNLPVYVDNFLGFPVGGIVPVGYYDSEQDTWISSENGVIVQVLEIVDGKAVLDIDGSGLAATEAELSLHGITDEELIKVAKVHTVGNSYWRVAFNHFTPWDCNWPYGPINGAVAPNNQAPTCERNLENPDYDCGSIIDVHNQSLGESVEATGSSTSLYYNSRRMNGFRAANRIKVPLTGDSYPSVLKKVVLDITVAGQRFTRTFAPSTSLEYEYLWDGKDGYGRYVKGKQNAKIRVGYTYDLVYQEPANFARSFAMVSGVPMSANRSSRVVTLWQESSVKVGKDFAPVDAFNGWTPGQYHTLNLTSLNLYKGNGTIASTDFISAFVKTVGSSSTPWGIAVSPTNDKVVYVAEQGNRRIVKYDENGTKHIVAQSPDVNFPDDIIVTANNTIYFTERRQNVIKKISPDGSVSVIAGTGVGGYNGDNIPATQAKLNWPFGLALGLDNELYFADRNNKRIRKINKDGTITTVAGGGSIGVSNSESPALQTDIGYPCDVTFDSDNNIYISAYSLSRILKVDQFGSIKSIAGTGVRSYNGDGIPAVNAALDEPSGITVDDNGNVIIADRTNNRVRMIDKQGIIHTLAGGGQSNEDNGLPTSLRLSYIHSVAVAKDGTVYFSEYSSTNSVKKITTGIAGFGTEEIVTPSKDGTKLYVFSTNGKHQKTVDAISGKNIWTFVHDSTGLLSSIVDSYSDTTHFKRNSNGQLSAIVGPYGDKTDIVINSDGYISEITNPAGETILAEYSESGMMASFTNAEGNTSRFFYDEVGRLTEDVDALGGYTRLERQTITDGYKIIKTQNATDQQEYVTTYFVEQLSNGDVRRRSVGCCGGEIISITHKDGSETVTKPDGTVITTTKGPDPRFGMQAPITTEKRVTYPSGKSSVATTNRTVELSDINDPLSIVKLIDSTIVNGDLFVTTYSSVDSTIVSVTPSGKIATTFLDTMGVVVKDSVKGIEPISYTYDEKGFLTATTQGTGIDARTTTIEYNAKKQVERITDPLNQVTTFAYDLAGRLVSKTLPDNRVITFDHNKNGSVTAITPPEQPAHIFNYNAVNLVDSYDAPEVDPSVNNITGYEYNKRKQVTKISRPGGQVINFEYDSKGRLSKTVTPDDSVLYSYDPQSNNLTEAANSISGLSYSYDGSALVGVQWLGAVSGKVEIRHNSALQIDTQSVNDAYKIGYTYDNDGQLAKIGELTLKRAVANGRLSGSDLGNVNDTIIFNDFGGLKSYRAQFGVTDLFNEEITETDKLGRIVERRETVDGVASTYRYSYDSRGQLVQVDKDGMTYAVYGYDANGNRVSYSGEQGVVSAEYDDQDRLITYGSTSYTYSDDGNVTSKTDGSGTTTYQYDLFGNLKSVQLAGGTTVEYLVDASNRRIGKKVGGTLVKGLLYQDKLNPVAELDNQGNVVSRFVYGIKGNVPDYMVKGGATYRIVSDHLGSVRMVVNNTTGEVVQKINYDEFGTVTEDSNPGFQPFGYAGGLYDSETALVRFGARDYDSFSGRWMSKDPIGFAGGDANIYRYCGNDPVNYVDIEGEAPVLLVAVGAAIVVTSVVTAVYNINKYFDRAHERRRDYNQQLEDAMWNDDYDTFSDLQEQRIGETCEIGQGAMSDIAGKMPGTSASPTPTGAEDLAVTAVLTGVTKIFDIFSSDDSGNETQE